MAWEKANPEQRVAVDYVQAVGPPLTFPIRLVLPWSALCSDNERESPSLSNRGGRPYPIMVKTARFKVAREKVRAVAHAAMTVEGFKFPPLTHALSLVGRLYTPTQRRVDATNFAKGVQDALSKIVYEDDQQLRDVRWVIAGPHTDAPRAEIEILPL
jgi:Holliday junction resolvase RusA-like endonuclease